MRLNAVVRTGTLVTIAADPALRALLAPDDGGSTVGRQRVADVAVRRRRATLAAAMRADRRRTISADRGRTVAFRSEADRRPVAGALHSRDTSGRRVAATAQRARTTPRTGPAARAT